MTQSRTTTVLSNVALMAALPLAACFHDESAETPAVEPPQITTFTTDIEQPTDVWGDRMPADPGRTILVPSTTLFPGAARVDPGVENPYSGDDQAIAAGKRHFTAYNCAGCHAPLGGGGMGPPLSDEEWIYGGEPAQMYLSIMHGRPNGMPAWGSMLPEKTVWELIAHIETLDEIEDYAQTLGFDENVGGFRDTGDDNSNEEEETQDAPRQGQ